MWPFRRTEKRDLADGDEVVRHLQALATGGTLDSGALAVAEACAGLWERSLASATIEPMSAPLRPLTACLLGLMGRGLAYRGEFVGAIEVADGPAPMVTVLPASSWDVRGRLADPMTWRYRVDLSGPDGTMTYVLPADGVLHVRLADPRTPWRGRSPLDRAASTADLSARIERSLVQEAKVPVARIASQPGTPSQLKEYVASLREGGILASVFGQPLVGEQVPATRFSPAKMQPDPSTVIEALRTAAGQDIVNAYGVPATLFSAQGDGSGQREAWRRFWAGTMQPLAMLVQDELKMKLDMAATVTLEALRASDEDGRSRAVARRAQAFKTLVDAKVDRTDAMRLAGLES